MATQVLSSHFRQQVQRVQRDMHVESGDVDGQQGGPVQILQSAASDALRVQPTSLQAGRRTAPDAAASEGGHSACRRAEGHGRHHGLLHTSQVRL